MRSILEIVLSSYAAFAFADRQAVVTCDTSFQLDGPKIPVKITIFEDGKKVTAVTQQGGMERESPVEVTEAGVRENLSPESVDQNLNLAEQLVVHAMSVQAEPELKNIMSSGVDLQAVRSAKVYDIDPNPNTIGKSALVDAKDAQGKSLGKFIGGLLVSPCK